MPYIPKVNRRTQY